MATPIMGRSQATASQMREFLRSRNPDAPDYSQLYLDIGAKYGVRGDLAFAQSMHETGYWRFTGTVRPYQNNFSGLGAVTSDTRGAMFATPALGIEAQIQHLYGYATNAPLPAGVKVVDPRFDLLQRSGLRGIAPNWEDLSGRWAVPGVGYGESIVRLWQEMLQTPVSEPIPTPPPQVDPVVAQPTQPDPADPLAIGLAEAMRLGLLQGYEDNTLRPDRPLTRAELAVVLKRLAERLGR